MAKRAEKHLPVEALPPFPGPETPEQEAKRILGYKHLCLASNGKPVSLTRRGESTFQVQELTNDMKPESVREFQTPKDGQLESVFLPDYDRNAAVYPVAKEFLSNRRSIDMTRRVKKRIKDVPADKLDVFQKFIEGGDGIEVVCGNASGIPLMEYSFAVKLTGEEYTGRNVQAFTYISGKGGQNVVAFVGTFSEEKLPEKYQKDLVAFLMWECLVRVSTGTAKIEGEVTPNELVEMSKKALCVMYTERKHWKEIIGVTSFVLDRAIENKASLNTTARLECELGEALEACAFYSQAALLYAEAGKHFHHAGDPKTARVMHYAGLAWKRFGDYEQAESFYALSLQSMRFQHDHAVYHHEVFHTLKSLFLIYYDPEKNIAPLNLLATLRGLILAAGEEAPVNVGFVTRRRERE